MDLMMLIPSNLTPMFNINLFLMPGSSLLCTNAITLLFLRDGYYSDTPKFVPRKLHQVENFVDHLIL